MIARRRRIGRAMARAVAYVETHPGCVMRDAARAVHVGAYGRNNALGYDPIHRAIRAGVLTRAPGPRRGTYVLTVRG